MAAMEYQQDSIADHIDKKYQKIEKIGSGAYGYVWKVRERKTQKLYALKKIFLAFQNDTDAQRTYREIGMLRQLNHPNVVKLEQVIRAENDIDLYLVFEYLECDLFNAIKDGVLNETHKKYIVYQLANTLVYLHSCGILHRDLKPSNILINSACQIKICDFGLSRTMSAYDGQEPNMTEFIATRWYRAPEVLFGSTKYSYKSDMWSLGCLIYEIFAARSLLPGNDSVNQIEKVLQFKGFPSQQEMAQLNVDRLDVLLSHFQTQKVPESQYFKPNWSPQLVQLLQGLLQYNPKTRWGPEQVLQSGFISQFKNFQPKIISQKPVILKISDNKKMDKDFYRNFIYKVFTKTTTPIHLKKSNILSEHSSLSQTKRAPFTTTRKNLASTVSSLHSKIPSSKSISNTFHTTTTRNSSLELRKSTQTHRVQKSLNVSPYKSKTKENRSENSKGKSLHRQYKKDVLKQISTVNKLNPLKPDLSRKTLKRKVIAYNI